MDGNWHLVDPADWGRTANSFYQALYQKVYREGPFCLWSFESTWTDGMWTGKLRFRYHKPSVHVDKPLTYWFSQQQIDAASLPAA
jgi:hypothetical protein